MIVSVNPHPPLSEFQKLMFQTDRLLNTDWLVIQDNSTPDGSLTAAGGDYTAGIGGS